jgi:hypothetical protein
MDALKAEVAHIYERVTFYCQKPQPLRIIQNVCLGVPALLLARHPGKCKVCFWVILVFFSDLPNSRSLDGLIVVLVALAHR